MMNDIFKNIGYITKKHNIQKDFFLYEFKNFDICNILYFKNFCLDFANIIILHYKNNVFDKELLANLIHIGGYIAQKNVNLIEYKIKDKIYSSKEFDNILEDTIWEGNSFVDFANLYFYLLQDYCLRSNTDNFQYINETIPDIDSLEIK